MFTRNGSHFFHKTLNWTREIFSESEELERTQVSYGLYGITPSWFILGKPKWISDTPKSVAIEFWRSPQAIKALELTFSFLYYLRLPPSSSWYMKALKWEQCLFSKHLPSKVKRFNALWPLLIGVTLSAIWIQTNDLIFNKVRWMARGQAQKCHLGGASWLGEDWVVACALANTKAPKLMKVEFLKPLIKFGFRIMRIACMMKEKCVVLSTTYWLHY
jgi:hypothetical protein